MLEHAPLVCFCVICISGITAQDMAPDTILNLNDVTIYSSRINRFAKGQAVITLDSLTRTEYPAGSLAELMTGFYIFLYSQLRAGHFIYLIFQGNIRQSCRPALERHPGISAKYRLCRSFTGPG